MAAIPAPPRENQPFDPNVQLWPDVRFKGYPSQNFDSPRIPLTKPDPRFTRDSELNPLVNRVPTKAPSYEPDSNIKLWPDARFKGYPAKDFESPRIPLTKRDLIEPEPVRGPLGHYNSTTKQFVDVRFQGYPSQNFTTPRVPLTQQDPRDSYQTERQQLDPSAPPAVLLLSKNYTTLFRDARFKGYPSQFFESPRIPRTKPALELTEIEPQVFHPLENTSPQVLQINDNNREATQVIENNPQQASQDIENNQQISQAIEYNPQPVDDKVAPREIKPAPKISEADLFQDFRFKGYPNVGNDFVSPRIPLTKPATEPSTMRDHQDRPRRRIDEYFPDEVSPRFTEKKVKEREDINEFLKQKQFEREMKEREKKREQREAFKMLQESNEFGKPGAGAPNHLNDHRKQKFTEEDLSKRRTPPRYPDQFDQEMARQRVDSRNRDTYRFPPNEKEIYARQIEADVQNRTLRDQTKKIDEMKGDLEMLKNETGYRGPSPYRAGPDSFAQMQSQSFGEKVWEDMAPRRTGPATQYQDDFYNLGQPAPRRKNNWEQPRIYHPFGKPGAGAPLKDVEGNIITGRRGQMAHMYTREELRQKKRAADELHLELQRGAEEQKRNREAEASFRKAPIGEFASLIEDGKVGKPVRDPNTGSIIGKSIPISDVSQMRMNMHPANHDQKVALHNYLTKQSEYNNREKHLQRLKDNQLSRKHHETMDNSWGRAGGGAPKGPHLQKFNLENSLYQWDSLAAPQEYIRSKDWSHINDDQQQKLYDQIMVSEQQGISHEHRPPIFARTTVPSTHANQYEYPEAGLKKNYVLDVPFATQYGRTTY